MPLPARRIHATIGTAIDQRGRDDEIFTANESGWGVAG
jgi:hypothetical protein